ncbi:MAG: hypothetical protein QXT47_05975 [Desulfurococcaceae archaeon]
MIKRFKFPIVRIILISVAVIIAILLTTLYYVNSDMDNDGLTYWKERELKTDPWNPDTDGDGLKDGEEVFIYRTDPLNPDTDGDGLKDLDEITITLTDPLNPDTDGDGLKDGDEVLNYGTNPLRRDSDEDGLDDYVEAFLRKYNTDPLNPDTDGDGLKDGEEVFIYRTDPLNPDTDGDGLKDGEEVLRYFTDPLDPDTDKDGFIDGIDFWPTFNLKLNIIIIYWNENNVLDEDGAGDPYFVIEVIYYPDEQSPSTKIRVASPTFVNLSTGVNVTSITIDIPDYFYYKCFIYIYVYDNDTFEGKTYDDMYYLNTTIHLGEIQKLLYLKVELDKNVDIENPILLSNKDKTEVDATVEALLIFIKSK